MCVKKRFRSASATLKSFKFSSSHIFKKMFRVLNLKVECLDSNFSRYTVQSYWFHYKVTRNWKSNHSFYHKIASTLYTVHNGCLNMLVLCKVIAVILLSWNTCPYLVVSSERHRHKFTKCKDNKYVLLDEFVVIMCMKREIRVDCRDMMRYQRYPDYWTL